MEKTRGCWWDGLVCGCLVVLAVLSTFPFVEMGFCDDFSYIKTAYAYAQTGHFVYNGGASAMLGWQIPWGALFLKVFGFSFVVARCSMLPIALAAVWMFFAILIRLDVSRRNAYFGTLLLGLSPLFLPLAASFMTDISSVLVVVLCIYCCLRAVGARTDTAAILWLATAAATNVVGGTVRQIAWLGALVMVPSTACLLRKRRGVLIAGFVCWCLSAASIFALMQWWKHQPYSLPEPILPQHRVSVLFFFHRTLMDLINDYLCLCLLILPLLAGWLGRMKPLRPVILTVILVSVACVQALSIKTTGSDIHMLPWRRDVLGNLGTSFEFSWALGKATVIFSDTVRYLLSYAIIAVAAVFLFKLLSERPLPHEASMASSSKTKVMDSQVLFWIPVPFAVAYLALLIPRGLWGGLLDRYFLCLLPLAIACLLKLYQDRFSSSVPAISYVLLAAWTFFAIGGTHDWFALNRARLNAASSLRASGIPKTEMQVGFDYDGWTQLEHSPTIVDPRIRVPSPVSDPRPLPNLAHDCFLFSWSETPVINPEYFVVLSQLPCLAPSHFAPIEYSTWLPPFHRSIYIQQRQ